MNSNQFLDWLDNKSQLIQPNSSAVQSKDRYQNELWKTDKAMLKETLKGSWKRLYFHKPLIMGIVNVTPDSFSDGACYLSHEKACMHALKLVEDGADIIDIGGEATNPGAREVSLEEELRRVIPVIQRIRKESDICISIDTSKPLVMLAAIEAGANWINDVRALRAEGALRAAASLHVPVCLMHMQGMPQTMQQNPTYPDGVQSDIKNFFIERIDACIEHGIKKEHLILDPGFGFGKNVMHNMQLMHGLEELCKGNYPLLLGVSRKNSIGLILSKEVNERLIGGLALSVFAALKGVSILRTHDVDETNQAMIMIEEIYRHSVSTSDFC